jgi:hypothetical protein
MSETGASLRAQLETLTQRLKAGGAVPEGEASRVDEFMAEERGAGLLRKDELR